MTVSSSGGGRAEGSVESRSFLNHHRLLDSGAPLSRFQHFKEMNLQETESRAGCHRHAQPSGRPQHGGVWVRGETWELGRPAQ